MRGDQISESTIARIAGNLLSGVPEDWLRVDENGRYWAVANAVNTARMIAEVVRNTRPRPARRMSEAEATERAKRIWGDHAEVSGDTGEDGTGNWLVVEVGQGRQHMMDSAGRVTCHDRCCQLAMDAGVGVEA
jgi:hypothetical protein